MYERNPELSMADLGRMFKISRERVRQIIAKSKRATTLGKYRSPERKEVTDDGNKRTSTGKGRSSIFRYGHVEDGYCVD